MNIAVYGKTMENRINVTLIRNEKDYLKGTSKPSYMSQNVVTTQGYYSLTLIVWSMKLKLKMFIKILGKTRKCLTLVIIQLSQNIMMIQTN